MAPLIPLLSLQSVSRRFGSFQAVQDVTIEFGPDDLNCIIGPNGAGKSTLLNMICGTLPVSSGSIRFGDHDLNRLSRHQIAALGIARKFQVPSVFPSLTVRENLVVATGNRETQERLFALAKTVQLESMLDVSASELSHGQTQWLEIGMALATNPKVLLLDEPTAGLSPDETQATASFLRELRGKVTVVVIEHDMAFVRDIRAKTVVLHYGEIIATGAFDDIQKNDLVRDVYLGRR